MSWPLVKLESIFEIARGGSPRPISKFITDEPDGLNWISIKDASNSGKYITKTKQKIRKEGLVKSRLVNPGDFLLTNSMSFGRPYIMKTTGCIHDGWLVLSGDKNKVNQDYFYYLFGSDLLHSKFSRLAAGAVVKNLNINLVKSVEIPLPPLPEQQKIAAILDAAAQLRQKDQQLIEHYTRLGQALFLEMFGDLSAFTSSQMSSVTKFIDYRGKTPKKTMNGVPLLTAKNVKMGYISESPHEFIAEDDYEDWMTRGFPKTGDVLFTTEAPLGHVALMPQYEKVALAQRLICIQPHKNLNSCFLMYVLFSSFFKQQLFNRSTGSTVKGVRSKELAQINIPLPPIELQNQFAQHIETIEQQKQQAQASLEKSEELFNSLLQRAFKGELTG